MKILARILAWLVGGTAALLLLAWLAIQLPPVQNFARQRAVSFLEGKLKTPVRIARVDLRFPSALLLEGVYFADQRGDTLLAGEALRVSIEPFKLLDNQLIVSAVELTGVTARLNRTAAGTFNFDYVVRAFVSDTAAPQPADTSAALQFLVRTIVLDRLRLGYADSLTANYADVFIGHFDTDLRTFDLDQQRYAAPAAHLANARLRYRNGTALATDVRVGQLTAGLAMLDLPRQTVHLTRLDLARSQVFVTVGKAGPATLAPAQRAQPAPGSATSGSATSQPAEAGWRVRSDALAWANNELRFDDLTAPRQPRGTDFAHLAIRDLALQATRLSYTPDSTSGNIALLRGSEQSGLQLTTARADFFYGPTRTTLRNFLLQTPHTTLQNTAQLTYASLDALTSNLGELGVEATLADSHLGMADVLLLVPALASQEAARRNPDATLVVSGRVSGRVNDLTVQNLDASALAGTRLRASAHVTGLPDVARVAFDALLTEFSTGREDLLRVLPSGILPANVRLPISLRASGGARGTLNQLAGNISVASSFGNATANGTWLGTPGRERYVANVQLVDLQLGKFTGQDTLVGAVWAQLRAEGTGLNPKTLTARVVGTVARAVVNGYAYRNVTFNGTAARGQYRAQATARDPNLALQMVADADLNPRYPVINATLQLDTLRLRPLRWATDDLALRGTLVAHVPTADPDFLNADVYLQDATLTNGARYYPIDSARLVATAEPSGQQSVHLRLPGLVAALEGQYQLGQLPVALQRLLARHYAPPARRPPAVRPSTAPRPETYAAQRATFSARVTNAPLLQQLVPDLKQLAPVTLNGTFDSGAGTMTLVAEAPRVVYGTNEVRNARLTLNAADSALTYAVTVDNAQNGSVRLRNAGIMGTLANRVLAFDLRTRDSTDREKYHVAGTVDLLTSGYRLRLREDGLRLNYDPWTASPGNALEYTPAGLLARDFAIASQDQRLSLRSVTPVPDAPLAVEFARFRLETLTRLVELDSLGVNGTLNGNALLRTLRTGPTFTADLTVRDLSFRADTLGDVALRVNNERANTYTAQARITGQGNQVNLEGAYFTDRSAFDLTLDVAHLNLASVEGFALGYLRQMTGALTGKLAIAGTTDLPTVRGDLRFKDANFVVSQLSTQYRLADESVSFVPEGVHFNKVALTDSAGNRATVDGTLFTKTFRDYRFGLDVASDNFRVLNAAPAADALYYGQVYLDSRVRIRGDLQRPVVDADLTVNPKTRLTLVSPNSDPQLAGRQGIIEYFDQDSVVIRRDARAAAQARADSATTGPTGMDVTATIRVDKEAEMTVIIDQSSGDMLRAKGKAELSGGIDPSGKTTLTGTYELEEGSYELSFNFIRRRFDIKKGSRLTWTGEPTDATVDITAVYRAQTAPIDLVENQLESTAALVRSQYKQRLPFDVALAMKGELLKPTISFDITLPEKINAVSGSVLTTVNTRLAQLRQQPSELNKQVFTLLLLNRFVAENPFRSGAGGGGIESQVRQSASQLLTDQLNRFAGELISGVNLTFDLQSTDDFTTGEQRNRTDLNVGLSKSLFNDRLTVGVGSNFNLEGPRPVNQRATNIAGDISVNYQLTKDGRYQVRAYRQNQYVVVQGQVVETGVGFILTLDYNHFREIFARSQADKKRTQK